MSTWVSPGKAACNCPSLSDLRLSAQGWLCHLGSRPLGPPPPSQGLPAPSSPVHTPPEELAPTPVFLLAQALSHLMFNLIVLQAWILSHPGARIPCHIPALRWPANAGPGRPWAPPLLATCTHLAGSLFPAQLKAQPHSLASAPQPGSPPIVDPGPGPSAANPPLPCSLHWRSQALLRPETAPRLSLRTNCSRTFESHVPEHRHLLEKCSPCQRRG